MEELQDQLRGKVTGFPEFSRDSNIDWIVLASSSGGTQAGLILGKSIYDLNARILGISIDQSEDFMKGSVATLVEAAADYLGVKIKFSPSDIEINADYLGGGYGVMGDLEREAIDLFARWEGLLLDPVYTGRAAGALLDLIRKGFFKPEQRILFWHTGGTPALFARRYSNVALRP